MRIAPFLRGAVLLLAALASLASSTQRAQPAEPQAPEPGSTSAGPGHCFSLATAKTTTSMCLADQVGCERERAAAMGDGLTTSECVIWQPVACFRLGGELRPEAEMCAANLQDCEVWRATDQAKNGRTGDPCAWKR